MILRLSLTCIVIIFLFIILINLFRSAIEINKLTVSTVDRGSLEITVTASGKVVPLSEEIITSPVTSKVLTVYKRSGELLEKGDPILQLDLATANVDYEKMNDELEMKRGKLEQLKANVEREQVDMEMQIRIDEMKLQRAEVLWMNEHFLDSIGSGTPDKIRQAKLDFDVQSLQLNQLNLLY